MERFCKLFEHPTMGQLLVKIDEDPDNGNPEVRFYTTPPELGVCSIAVGFTDGDWEKADAAFEKMDMEAAAKAVKPIWDMARG